ncbi:hypothetical protein [Devosia sp. XK-2]|uniref:hypothetical protein n=1 Tax=Devosia sp. XK-2 TaxID=3126689 RepID=UPI0030D613A1
MSSKLASALTVLSCIFTLIAAAIVLVGPFAAALIAAISAIAFAAWLWTYDVGEAETRNLLSPYLAIPPLFVALSAARYAGGWVELLATHYVGLFSPAFAFTGSNWFVLLVCTPATVILFGGYLLSRRAPMGRYMAWWAALYAVSEGVVQLAGGFAADAGPLVLVSATLSLALIGVGLVLLQRLLAPKAARVEVPPPLSDRQRLLWAALFVASVGVYSATLLTQAGPLPVFIVGGSMLGGIIGWWLTTSRVPADPSWSVPLFLLLLTLFYIHVGEEALTNFNGMIAEISGQPWSDYDFMILIGLIGPVVWFFAAWSLWKRQAIGNFIFWFLIVGMILGEPTHLIVFPIRRMMMLDSGYEYFSGMYTALFPMIPAILALVRITRDHRIGKVAS